MRIIYKLGDLFASGERCYIHGCNTHGIMGSGIAKTMRDQHPPAFAAYYDAYTASGLQLGEVIWAESNGVLIGNAITQKDFGRNSRVVYCDYHAIRTAIRTVNQRVAGEFETVGLPQIGAGLANGDWTIIAKIIEDEAKDFTPVVYILDKGLFAATTMLAARTGPDRDLLTFARWL
jgi:O-acetyl-ADP-ribose deacetylase (regulator of RNase III)